MTSRYRTLSIAAAAAGTVCLTAACGGGGSFSSSSSASGSSTSASSGASSTSGGSAGASQAGGKASLSILIGSSGAAETAAVKAAAAKWASSSGSTATVTPAQNMDQQLGQAFAANKPPDVFYLDASKFADYAANGALYAYGSQAAGAADFYPALKTAFTYKGTLYCAPKDFSTLAMEINTAMWKKAGLTNADAPTTWAQLTSVLQKLKSANPGVAPMVISPGHDRADAFLIQAGGGLTNADGTRATADTPQNVAGLTYLQGLLKQGLVKYSSQVGAGWGGEALGKAKAATTIEGNWIVGGLADYPKLKYTVVPLPAGAQKGTLTFTNCWGIPAASKYKAQAVAFVNAMTAKDQQLSFAKAFGVLPSLQSAHDAYVSQFPANKVFADGASYGVGPVKAPKLTQVLADYDNSLAKLATTDPKRILTRLQTNMQSSMG